MDEFGNNRAGAILCLLLVYKMLNNHQVSILVGWRQYSVPEDSNCNIPRYSAPDPRHDITGSASSIIVTEFLLRIILIITAFTKG